MTSSGYAPVNGLSLYYEVEGSGDPLICIPPAFGQAGVNTYPALTQCRTVIRVDLQGHGRTADIPERAISFEQHAADVVGLAKFLGFEKVDLFGQSFGGLMATLIAIRHPELVRRVATYGATFGPPQLAVKAEVLNSVAGLTPHSEGLRFLRENYEKVAPNPDQWPTLWSKVNAGRWNGFTALELASLQAPLLIALGDQDFVRLEHAVETFQLIPNAELAVIPDAGHFALFGEQDRVLPVVQHFLTKPEERLPLGTPLTGYRPGATR